MGFYFDSVFWTNGADVRAGFLGIAIKGFGVVDTLWKSLLGVMELDN